MRSRTSMHTSRTSGHDLEDFRERRSVVCMIDRVCFVMYRCNYELLISPYNLFHPTTKNTLQPGRLLRLWAAVTDCSVCVGNRENPPVQPALLPRARAHAPRPHICGHGDESMQIRRTERTGAATTAGTAGDSTRRDSGRERDQRPSFTCYSTRK